MKNHAVAPLLFMLLLVCALPAPAQKKQPSVAKPGAKTVKPSPAPSSPATTPPPTTAAKSALEQPGVIQGKVVDLGWGDAITVLDAQGKQHRVRLLGIDAPEKEQAYGPTARQKLSALVFSKAVSVKYQKTDRNGRPLGKVLLGAMDVNLEMLKAGLAWYYANDRDLPETDRPLYANAEQGARTAPRGLWQDEAPIPPWEFRQARRQKPGTPDPESAAEPAPVVVADGSNNNLPDKEAAFDKNKEVADAKAKELVDGKPAEPSPNDQGDEGVPFPKSPKERIVGDSTTRTYYKAGCPEVEKVPAQNRVSFVSAEEAEKAGFKRTPNCP